MYLATSKWWLQVLLMEVGQSYLCPPRKAVSIIYNSLWKYMQEVLEELTILTWSMNNCHGDWTVVL